MYQPKAAVQNLQVVPDYLGRSEHMNAQGQWVEDSSPTQDLFATLPPTGSAGPAGGGMVARPASTQVRTAASSSSSSSMLPMIAIGGVVLAGLGFLVWRRFH